MSKFNLQKGDKIRARSSAIMDENTFQKIGGHIEYVKPLTVTKVFYHGVKTMERGYIHNRNILGKSEF